MQTILESPNTLRSSRLSPAELAKLDHPTPFLLMDLEAVDRAYRAITTALPDVAIRYATKCNPDARILARLHSSGSGFEIASCSELRTLTGLGVRADDVIFSSPIKPWKHIREAAKAGVWRFAFDSRSELDKLAEHAPGAAVYVRLGTGSPGSKVPSEGKFGVSGGQAIELMRSARSLGLRPYGIAYHVGSQMTEPRAWEQATRRSAAVLRELQAHDITLRMLNIGGGFPARYAEPVPDLSDYGACIRQAADGVNLNTASFDRRGRLWFTGQGGVYGNVDPGSGRVHVVDAPAVPVRTGSRPRRMARSITPRWPEATSPGSSWPAARRRCWSRLRRAREPGGCGQTPMAGCG